MFDTMKKPLDAITLLKDDHRTVKDLFKQFEKIRDDDESTGQKKALVQRICTELRIHAAIEEEIFYPAVRAAIDDTDLIDEADVEHASAKALIAELEGAGPGDDHYDARVTVLSEYIDHHVKEEEGQMFPKARKAVDIETLGAALADRKAQLADGVLPEERPRRKAGEARASTASKAAPARRGSSRRGTARRAQ
jgi:hemerythrin superfamily protein